MSEYIGSNLRRGDWTDPSGIVRCQRNRTDDIYDFSYRSIIGITVSELRRWHDPTRTDIMATDTYLTRTNLFHYFHHPIVLSYPPGWPPKIL